MPIFFGAASMNNRDADPNNDFSTLVEMLRWRAVHQPEQRAYTYLVDGETEGGHLTFAELDRQARKVAVTLQHQNARGERVLLLYPPGLEFIAAFFGSLYAGAIAVPLPPPNHAQPRRTLPRLRSIVNDARPLLALTTSSILSKIDCLVTLAPELREISWVATDSDNECTLEDWRDPAITDETLALLQYTSGSTAVPKGVMVSHRNLLANSAYINSIFDLPNELTSVTWLPAFHDMGLTNGIIQPLFKGRNCYLMPPQSFLQRPVLWLQAISRSKATISGGPNFAYELCVRKVTPEQRTGLDLSGWKVAYNGAEPVRADTMMRFVECFASCGFKTSSFYPSYGLAEATLLVSGESLKEKMLRTVEVSALEQNRAVEVSEQKHKGRMLVGCGGPMLDTGIVIVNPETLTTCPSDGVGEIWVSGPGVTSGYWNKPEESERTCRAFLSDTGEGPFLRTGDLGFLGNGELFITGRLKDLIIIGGRNLYPQEIELTVQQSHPAVRPACCAAFSVDVADEERLIVAAEVEPRYLPNRHSTNGNGNRHGTSHPHCNGRLGRLALDAEEMVRAIRRAVAEEHDVRVHAVLLLRAGSIPKTSSGKLQRNACQASFLDGTLAQL
jgi:acyl-CoA synthetase (AMP-forming)/AMP-acid ligase II